MTMLHAIPSPVQCTLPADVDAALAEAWLLDQAELPTPDDAPGVPEDLNDLNDLADWLEAESAALRPRNDCRAHWLSRTLAELAGKARFLSARTPDEFDFRDADNHLELLCQRYDQGFEDGRKSLEGQCHYCGRPQ